MILRKAHDDKGNGHACVRDAQIVGITFTIDHAGDWRDAQIVGITFTINSG